jgi:hypothetical protein
MLNRKVILCHHYLQITTVEVPYLQMECNHDKQLGIVTEITEYM